MKNPVFGMPNRRTFVLTVAAFFSFSMWFFVDRVWSPPVEMHFSDLYPRWYGSRELLLRGRDPYSPAVTWEIASWASGRAVELERSQENRGEDRLDHPSFAYPLYVAFILSPTVCLPYPKVESLFRLIMPSLAFLSVPLWLSALRWKCDRSTIAALALLSFGSFPTLENIYLQQPALLAAACLAASASALARKSVHGWCIARLGYDQAPTDCFTGALVNALGATRLAITKEACSGLRHHDVSAFRRFRITSTGVGG